MNEQTEGTTQPADAQPQAEDSPLHATIALRMGGNGINLEVTNSVPTMTEAVHFANWFGLNLDALVLLARQDWHLRMEMNRLELQHGAQQLQQAAQGGAEPAVVESATPRLLAANGGPLQ